MIRYLAIIMLAFMLLSITDGSDTSDGIPIEAEIEDNLPDKSSMDADGNGIHDTLQNREDRYVDIFICYDRLPTDKDIERVEELGITVSSVNHYVDHLTCYKVERSLLPTIIDLPHVFFVEEQIWMWATLDTGTPAVKARTSSAYSPETAWDSGYTGQGVVIAILDTGVDDQHESLDGKFIAGVDVSNPGFQINGNPDDGNGHGTHCAGIAMGNGGTTDDDSDGEPDFQGVAPDADLVDVKISSDLGVSPGQLQDGIQWSMDNKAEHGIDILSISFGTLSDSDGSDQTCLLANEAVLEHDLVVVVAAGNEGPDNDGIGSPAAADEVITVANSDNGETIPRSDDVIHSSSSRGPRSDDGDEDPYDEMKPEISAPGTDINSCQYSSIGQVGFGYTEKTGTSMACPMVSGIAALMKEANSSLPSTKFKQVLIDSSESRGNPSYPDLSNKYNFDWGYGLADAYWACRLALDPDGSGGGGGVIDDSVHCKISNIKDNETLRGVIEVIGTADTDEGSIDDIFVWWDSDEKFQAVWDDQTLGRWIISIDTNNVTNGVHNLSAKATSGPRESITHTVSVFVKNGDSDSGDDDNVLEQLLPFPFEVGLLAIPASLFLIRKRRRQ